jgi:EAL domain-containing protein (putative c-di-GMP-specific phosphodiesterase class I)
MLRVKELRRGTYFFYEEALNERMQFRRAMSIGLSAAIAAGDFELHYQPLFSAKSLEIAGAEALMRWRHREHGMIQPAQFIPIAEETGLIVPLGAWAIEEACRTAADWPEHVEVAVNLSPVQFERPGLVEAVAGALAQSGLRPSRLRLEVTESVLLHDNAANISILDRLKELGVSVALDDFGTGYSSLSYLQRFAFDRIKIDHSFVRNIGAKAGSLKIVHSIVMLAHSLGLCVTAEGVETEAQFTAVREEGCEEIQGFFLGGPLPAKEFRALVHGGRKGKRARVRTAS